MPTTSSVQGVPIPVAGDSDNVPYDLGLTVGFMEKRLVMVFASAADRDAKISAPAEGMAAYLQDTDELTLRIGTAWVRMLSRNDLGGNGGATTASRSDHTHDDRYFTEGEADGRFAAIGHNHSGVYQPAGSYAAASHGHDYAASYHTHPYMESGGSYTMGAQYPFTFPNLTVGTTYNLTLSSGFVMQRSSSSRRYKKEIEALSTPVESLWGLRPVQYRYDNAVPEVDADDRLMGGFIAEEVAEVFEEGVIRNPDGEPEDVDTRALVAAVLALCHDLDARLKAAGL